MPKTVYLILLLLFLLAVLAIVQFSIKPKSQPEVVEESKKTMVESFRIVSSTVPEEFIGITEPIKLTFSKPVILSSLFYEFTPKTEVRAYTDSTQTEVTFDPKDAWNFESEYSLRISKESQATDGQALDKEYTYIFKTYPHSGI